MLIKPLKTIIFTIILGMVYIMPTVARAACAENEIDVLGDGTQCETAKFTILSMLYNTHVFIFNISAQGTFYVDCGDGGTLSGTGVSGKTITRTDTTEATYTCTYQYPTYDSIRFGGMATVYNTTNVSTIRFDENLDVIEAISGSLGAIFPTIGTSQPRFISTFEGCGDYGTSFTIPEELFTGIVGAPVSNMFYRTFANSLLYGSIPDGLFSGISGAPAESMFASTFAGCHYLTGSIPEGLFSGISGAPAESMFASTFEMCDGLTGSIPAGLFSGISGAPAESMFSKTFSECSGLTGSIPEGLFSGISGAPAESMFASTFEMCRGLTGSIPAGLFSGISGAPAKSMFASTFAGCHYLTGSIPEGLFSGISGAPAESMFANTFNSCSGLTGSIPAGLFSGISGAPAKSMFLSTFSDCSGLSGSIPENLFGNLSGEGANLMFLGAFSYCSELSGYVPKNIFENITSTGTYGTNSMFEETNLYTECPCGTKPAETGWGAPLVDGRAVCQANPAEHIYNDVCYQDCGAGVTKIKTSTGLEFPLFDTSPTTPSLHIQHNGTVCYTPMELGDGGANSMNIISGGAAYHLGTLE